MLTQQKQRPCDKTDEGSKIKKKEKYSERKQKNDERKQAEKMKGLKRPVSFQKEGRWKERDRKKRHPCTFLGPLQ